VVGGAFALSLSVHVFSGPASTPPAQAAGQAPAAATIEEAPKPRAPDDLPPPDPAAAIPTLSVDQLPRAENTAALPEPQRPGVKHPPIRHSGREPPPTGVTSAAATPAPVPSTGYGYLE
jgi:hypothetical protein